MTQSIITYMIIAGAVFYTAYSLYVSFVAKGSSHCDGCKGCESKVGSLAKTPHRDLKKRLMEIKHTKTHTSDINTDISHS